MCSYNAPNQLLPPHELIALGGICRDIENTKVLLVDAIAEQLDTAGTVNQLKLASPDFIVTLHGFECFQDDMEVLREIKAAFPNAKIILFGHYATLFPEEILRESAADILLLGEPDFVFEALIQRFLLGGDLKELEGIAYKTGQSVIVQRGDFRIPHPDLLPMPAYDLLKSEKYFEPFLKPPLGLIQSARGCPYNCNYCIRSFGKRLTYRTSDQIIEEILFLKEKFGIQSLRFIDDTFTVHTKRVVEICQKMIENKINIDWTCLSRVDTLKQEMIPWLKKAGCKRVYFGIESGSSSVLEYLDKDVDLSEHLQVFKACSKHRIETIGFFVVGSPNETRKDFLDSIQFAINADLDYITVNKLIPYPGTPLFDKLKAEINFSLFPYKNEWINTEVEKQLNSLEKEFYRKFYFRWRYVFKTFKKIWEHPLEYLDNVKKLGSYILSKPKGSRSDFI
jgi:anaerobic magnesium-protoporphyrin IX monomethyl ester cyclase